MKLPVIDISIILIYMVFVLALGWWRKSSGGSENYLLMGRRMTLPAFVATLVSSWYGGILGVSEYTYSYGVSNWLVFGVPYYVFGIVFALFLVPWARRANVTTLPELISRSYGPRAGLFASLWVLVLGSPAAYVLTIGFLFSFFFGLPLAPALILGTVISALYIFRGGLRSVVRTDMLQFILMFAGFAVMVLSLTIKLGSPIWLFSQLPESHLAWDGGQGLKYVIVWFFIASWTLIDPGFHQRIYSASSDSVARRGILLAVVFWLIFDILTTLTGLYALVALPGLELPSLAFLELSRLILPVGISGLFIVGILATVMSTLDSTVLVSGMTLGHDILPRIPQLHKFNENILLRTGIVMALTGGLLLAWLLPSVVDIWYTLGTLTLPALLLPVLWAYQRRFPALASLAFYNMLLAPLISAGWWFWGHPSGQQAYYFGLEPFYPGMFFSIGLYGSGLLAKFRKKVTHVT